MPFAKLGGIGMAGKSDDRLTSGRFETLSPDEELVAAICDNDPQTAARLLRELDALGRHALDALADMLDGGITKNSDQPRPLPVVLRIASARGPGRPRTGDVRSVISQPGRVRKTRAKSPGRERMIAARVQRFIDSGLTRARAIEEARQYFPFALAGQKKPASPSFSAVEKAYDRYRNELRPESRKPERRVLK